MEEEDRATWKARIDSLRTEMLAIWGFAYDMKMQGRMTMTEVAETCTAFNAVFSKAGRNDPQNHPDNALTFALFRDAVHQMRSTLLRLRPELAEDLSREAPESRSRE